MSRKRPPPPTCVNADDADMFREAIGSVRRLDPAPTPPSPPRPQPRPRQREDDEVSALEDLRARPFQASLADPAEPLAYRRPEFPELLFKRLRRGEFAAQDEVDLHHLTATHAEALLREFLREARHSGLRCVRVIHGKGRNSEYGTPVLKLLVDRILGQRSDVLAYTSAPARQGGTGAVLVLLADRRRR